MRTILTEMTMCGFKGVKKPITIQFTNKKINKETFDKPIIKAIYGTNGEGKTAIIHALDVFKNTIASNDYLTIESAKGTLGEIINKQLREASISLKYATYTAEISSNNKDASREIIYFEHSLEYGVDDNSKVFIKSEKLSMRCPAAKINKDSPIFEVKNGEIVELSDLIFEEEEKKGISDKSKNLLTKTSLLMCALQFLTEYIKTAEGTKKRISMVTLLVLASLFPLLTQIYLDDQDSHEIESFKIDEIIKQTNYLNSKEFDRDSISIDKEVIDIDAKDLDIYKKEVKKIESFLKIFKPDLKKIDVDASPVGKDKYRCKKYMVYKDGSIISSEYESSGIKKLMKLYPVLSTLEIGGIAVIDEFDSNIHDVYLCKIIEYVMNYTKGQLIFTTHNLGPMELLDKSTLKHTVDFVNNSEITSWKKNGNYSIVKVYRGGAIPNCPFNIDAADFVKVFGK